MGNKLSASEINRRSIELRNLKRLHERDQVTKGELRAKVKRLEAALEDTKAQMGAKIEAQAVLIAELQKAVFGSKRRRGGAPKEAAKTSLKPRSKASYRRPLPDPASIADKHSLTLEKTTCACGGSVRKTAPAVRFIEDIPLPELTAGYQARLVSEYVIERGVCLACGKAKVAQGWDLGGQPVRLGKNLRLLVCQLVAVGLSYSKIRRLLKSLYRIEASSGEIAAILKKAHRLWQPAYQNLLESIRAGPSVHIDETPWPVRDLQGGGYAWVTSSANGGSCLALRDSRGGAHARKLLGGFKGVRISDGYAAYSNPALGGKHQLCWAHLYRNIRELRYNSNLPAKHVGYVKRWYEEFAGLYADLRGYLAEPAAAVEAQIDGLQSRLDRLLNLRPPRAGEPLKLSRLRKQLRRASAADKLFVCLRERTPCDNNRAERDLRPLVIKRKNSFGSVSEAGANALATVLSICANTWRTDKDNYFQALAAL